MSHPVYNNDQIVNQINNGGYWYDSSYQIASTISYGITTSNNWLNSAYAETAGWSAFNATQAATALTAIELWDDVIATDLVASADPNAADIRFSNSTTGVGYAHAYYPGQTGVDDYSYQQSQGSVWLNSNYSSLSDPDLGEYGFMAVAHEIGHTLGLSHPGNYNGGAPTYQNNAEFEQDTQMYSIMSYFDASNTGADWYASDGQKYYAQTPMVYDVLTAQSVYGADYTTRSGDTTYGFNSTEAGSVFDFTFNLHPIITIWDGAGNDTLDLSGWNTDSTISLVAGSYSNADQMTLNIAIAYGADIENAVGGGGNDTITGNGLDNQLSGNGGDDILNGAMGNDALDGGAGFDTAVYNTGGRNNYTVTKSGTDWLVTGAEGNDTVTNIEQLAFSDQDVWLDAQQLSFSSKSAISYGDDAGAAQASLDGTTLTLTGDAWKRLEINKTITADTILSFDFNSNVEGGFQGIGFDTDNSLSAQWLFQLDGADSYGLQNYTSLYTTGTGYLHYEIAVGDFFTGDFKYLTLANDDNFGLGADSAFKNISFTFGDVQPPPPPPPPPPAPDTELVVDGTAYTPGGYGGTQDRGTATIGDNGASITLSSNAWKQLALSTTITADTILSFDFKSDVEGEIHGIGFDTDNNLSPEWLFQLDGTQAWGLQDYTNQYTTGSGYQRYEIAVGQFFTGDFSNLIFATDDDANVGADSAFKNIQFTTATPVDPGNTTTLDLTTFEIGGFAGYQDRGTATVGDNGASVTLSSNAWKQLAINTTITADTILSFDFKSDVEGEIHGIGFDTDNNLSPEWLFQLDGTQTWGLQDFANQYSTGSGYQSYEIRVGDYFTGDFTNLVLATDDDADIGADSAFRNIQFTNASPLVVASAVETYGDTQDRGNAFSVTNDAGYKLTSNAWKKIDLGSLDIDANTILTFDFKSDVEGEIHGIGFDIDDSLSEQWLFQIDGTQVWGLQSAADQYTTGSGYQSYEIRIGDYYQGAFDRLVIAMDDDAEVGADSYFDNITISNLGVNDTVYDII